LWLRQEQQQQQYSGVAAQHIILHMHQLHTPDALLLCAGACNMKSDILDCQRRGQEVVVLIHAGNQLVLAHILQGR
jgi:hypothetical protein